MPCFRCAAIVLLLSLASSSSIAEVAPVTLPQGETNLSELGTACIGYQIDGQEPVMMPQGWDGGQADPESGIVFWANGQQQNRPIIKVHPPWRKGPGKEWFDYFLTLPPEGPIRLSFSIAMRYTLWGKNGDSDGVTFCCRLTVDGQEKELMRAHTNTFDWQDFDFDLTPYAGKTIRLRFQVDPGPKNDASCDASVGAT
jgi:hypothetical protein